MTIHEEIQDLIPIYVLGACEEEEAQRVERHVPSCRQCRHVLDEFQPAATALALATRPAQLPPGLKFKTMARALEPEPVKRAPAAAVGIPWWQRLGAWPSLLAAASVVSLVALLFGLWEIGQLNDEMARQRDTMAVIAYAQGNAITIRGTTAAPDATGRLYADRDSNVAALVTVNLPVLPQDKVYQLWLTEAGGTRVSGGLFAPDRNGNGLLLVRAPRNFNFYARVGVTMEPLGGSPGPTSGPLLQAQLTQ